jgi:hypothetical protein
VWSQKRDIPALEPLSAKLYNLHRTGTRQRAELPRKTCHSERLWTSVCRWLFIATLLQPVPVSGEPIPVRYPEGTTHGFLAVRTLEGKLLASGELTEVLHGDQVVSHLVFRFKDGSVDDETAVFSQRGTFRLISDHHIQKGPSFPHPTNVFIDASTGQVTVRYQDKDREKVDTEHLDLPADLANGIILMLLRNSIALGNASLLD